MTYSAKQLGEELLAESGDAIVSAIWVDENGKSQESEVYKYSASEDDGKIFLYLK